MHPWINSKNVSSPQTIALQWYGGKDKKLRLRDIVPEVAIGGGETLRMRSGTELLTIRAAIWTPLLMVNEVVFTRSTIASKLLRKYPKYVGIECRYSMTH